MPRTAFSRAAVWSTLFLITPVFAQQSVNFDDNSPPISFIEGWLGFTDLAFMLGALLTLTLAALLGAIIGYHPRTMALADKLEEIEAPKVYITCSVIGAIIGILVVKYGIVVGFVIFGIGGLMRFRTILGSANLTGNVILSTMIGLSCGLNLPHVAVLATAFSFALTFLLDSRPTYSISIKGVKPENMMETAAVYRAVLERNNCKIKSERKKLNKETLTLIFHTGKGVRREDIEEKFEIEIPDSLKGATDWLVE